MAATHPRFAPDDADGPKVTLVVGWGGVRCAAALGVVRALADAGIGVERVVGCSAGAIFAALTAFGYSIDESKAVARRLWTRELARRSSALELLDKLAARRLGSRPAEFGLGDPRMLLRGLAAAWGDKRIEAAPLPLHLTATDLATGELVELAAGPLMEGLRASLSLPPACAPQLNAILANNLLRAKLAFHSAAHHAEMIIIFPEFKHRTGLFDKDRLAYLIDAGEQAALQQLPYLHHLLSGDRVPAAA